MTGAAREAPSVLAPHPIVLEGLPVRIDPDEVLRFHGYKAELGVPAADALARFDEAFALGEGLLAPRVVYRTAAVSARSADLVEAGGERFHIPDIGRLWGPLEAVGAAICTAGEAIESRVRALLDQREGALAAMLDSVGSAAVESLAEHVNDLLCERALREGRRVTNRVSPGYAGWDTAEQAALFRLCPGAPAGVALDPGCVMTPAKSISFLVGIGADARVDHYFAQCRRCWVSDCAHRRTPAITTVHR